jgi:hypothetical protein
MQLLPSRPLAWALSFLCYGVTAIIAAGLSGSSILPEGLRNHLYWLTTPLLVLSLPLDPILRRFNMVVTAYWSFPTIPGLIVVVLFWTLVIYGAAVLVSKIVRS